MTWPDWSLKLRTSSSQEEGCDRDFAVTTVRAVGDRKYVGFFKRVRDTEFARRDSRIYSPLCLLLGLGAAAIVVS